MQLIDMHTHLGERNYSLFHSQERHPLTLEELIETMDRHNIVKSILLPAESPEILPYYFTTEDALLAVREHPERLIAFCSVDPRRGKIRERVGRYLEHGCKGYGELKVSMWVDDPLLQQIYEVVNDFKLPLTWHIDWNLCIDEIGLPRVEAMVKKYRDINFIMHAPGWWNHVSADCDTLRGYPKGPIKPGGRCDALLSNYENVWADISAGSGHNALTRDPEFTLGFIERHWKKLLFATDYLYPGQPLPQIEWLETVPFDEEKREAIGWRNAATLLGIES